MNILRKLAGIIRRDLGFFTRTDDFEHIICKDLQGMQIEDIKQIETGWTNFVFRVRLADDRNFVYRFPRDSYWVGTLRREVRFNNFIYGKVGVIVAKLEYRKIGGRGFSRHEMLTGQTLTEAYPFMNAEQKLRCAQDIARYIFDLSRVELKRIRLPRYSRFNTGFARMTGFEYKVLFTKFKECEKVKCAQALCHGDLNFGNILVDLDGKVVAVLDYAFASRFLAGYADLSVLLARTSDDFGEIVISEYEKIANTIIDTKRLDSLITVRREIEADYIKYIKKNHPDIKLPIM